MRKLMIFATFILLLCIFGFVIFKVVISGNKLTPQNANSKNAPQVMETYNPKNVGSTFYIKTIYQKDNKYFVDVDYVELINDYKDKVLTLEGTKACLADNKCLTEWCDIKQNKSCLPNGFYIRNNETQILSFELGENVSINIINPRQIEVPISIEFDRFYKMYNINPEMLYKGKDGIYVFKFIDNKIYSINQVYIP